MDGTLYGIGSQNRLYTVSPTGVASLLLPFNPPLNGTVVGFAVEPGKATIVTNLGQNLQLDLVGHVLSVGGGLAYASGQIASGRPVQGAPVIEDIAYSPGPNPQLYGLDANSQTLVRIVGAGDPSGGQVYTVNQDQAVGEEVEA